MWLALSSQYESKQTLRRKWHVYLNRELELIVEFGDEEIVSQHLARLHDPYDSCINLVLAVLKDSLMCAYLLLLLWTQVGSSLKRCTTNWNTTDRFFHLNLIDFDSEQLGFEVSIEGESIIHLNFLSFWRLVQDTRLAASKRL